MVDAQGLPTGEWKQTSGAGWLMSGPAKAPALQFLPSGAAKPSRVIYADGSEAHSAPNGEDPPTIVKRSVSNTTEWDPPLLQPGETATLVMPLRGAELGDALFCGKLSSPHPHLIPTS